MAKQLTEEELNIRRTARRRLIGAVALALAVVVFLPMLLESEPKPDGQDIDLRIPDPEKVGAFVPAAGPSAVNEMTSLDEPNGEPSPAESAASSVPETAAPAAAAKPEPAPAKPAPAAKSEPAAKPVAAAPAKSEPAAKPAAVPPAPPAQKVADNTKQPATKDSAAKAAKPAVGKYVVQVGAFSTVVKANSEVDKLKVWGYTAYTEQVGSATRVRIGPFAERSKADEVRRALEGHGLHPDVTQVK